MKLRYILFIVALTFIFGVLALNDKSKPDPKIDVIPSNPNIALNVKLNGYFDSVHPVKNLEEGDNRYYLEFKIIGTEEISKYDISILDNNNQEQDILDFEDLDDGSYTLWFAGRPNTKYKFVHLDIYSRPKEYTYFTTPSNKTNLTKIEKSAKEFFKQNLEKEIKEDLFQNLDTNWENITLYYIPTDKEKKAIVEAYWTVFIKGWYDTYQFQLSSVDDDTYNFEIHYKWSPPDMDALNRKIDEREGQLKKEFKNNPKKVYQTIISELPTMVKETPKLNETEDNKANFSLNREYFSADDTYSDLSISDLYTVTNPIRKIYP